MSHISILKCENLEATDDDDWDNVGLGWMSAGMKSELVRLKQLGGKYLAAYRQLTTAYMEGGPDLEKAAQIPAMLKYLNQ